jgi:hypothetical protein
MSFSASNPPRLLVDSGLYSLTPADSTASWQSATSNVWLYRSSDSSTDVGNSSGYFTSCGYGSRVAAAPGLRVGDVILAVPSTNATTPRATWLTCYASTCKEYTSTVGGSAWNATFNVSAST